jgi:predicted RNase H-like nuclease (RuvC/YqgF family)
MKRDLKSHRQPFKIAPMRNRLSYKDAIARLDEINASYSDSSDFACFGDKHDQNSPNSTGQPHPDAPTSDFSSEFQENPQEVPEALQDFGAQRENIEKSELRSENCELKSRIQKLQQQAKVHQTKNHQYEVALVKLHRLNQSQAAEVANLRSEVDSLKLKCSALESECEEANTRIATLSRQKPTDTTAIEHLNALIESQIAENSVIVKQRDSLLHLVNKQSRLFSEYEKCATTSERPAVMVQKVPDPVTDEMDRLYTTLAAVSKLGL